MPQKDDFHGGFVVTAAVNLASLAAGGVFNHDLAVPGILATDIVDATPPDTVEAGVVVLSVTVPSANTIRIRWYNPTAGAVDPALATWTFRVFRR